MRDQFGNLFEARLLKGKYKERPNNPKKPDGSIHQYCPPEQVDPEMERLLALHEEHEKKGVPVEIEAAWLHHRFTQIHPYQDGNGRVARALASLLFIRAGWFPVVVTREERARYIDALEVADEGDLRSFVLFITQIQRRSLLKTFQSAAEIRGVHSIDEALEAAKHALKSLGRQTQPTAWMRAKETADRLLEIANSRMAEIAASLNEEIARNGPAIEVILSQGPYNMATELQLPYTPNRTDYQQSLNLEFRTLSPYHWADAEIQAHAMGSTYRGLIGMVAVFVTEANTEMLSPELFQVNYLEPYESAERRFRPWLEESLVKALILWRKSL
jgi:fido (protein-threonine AMPylation protein)